MIVYLNEVLDVTRTGIQKTISGVSVGENGKALCFLLSKGDEGYTPPSGSVALLYTEKPDGTHGVYKCDVNNNGFIIAPVRPQMTSVAGNVRCQIEIITANQRVLYCPEFILAVAETVQNNTTIESDDDFQDLDDILTAAQAFWEKGGIHSVEELPDDAVDDTIVYVIGDGLYRYTGDEWTQLTDDETIETLAALGAATHEHSNKSVLDAITSGKVDGWDQAVVRSLLLQASSHTHGNILTLNAITSGKVSSWDEAAENSHTHVNTSILEQFRVISNKLYLGNQPVGIAGVIRLPQNADAGTFWHLNEPDNGLQPGLYEKVENSWRLISDKHTHGNKSYLDKLSENKGWLYFDGYPAGFKSVNTLPLEAPENAIVYLVDHGFYRYANHGWTQRTKDEDVFATHHTHAHPEVLERFTGTEETASYNGKTIRLYEPNNITLLDDSDGYSNLMIRDAAIQGESIQDVPFYVFGGELEEAVAGQGIELAAIMEEEAGYYKKIAIREVRQYDTGMPLRTLAIETENETYLYLPQAWDVDGSDTMSAGWYVDGAATTAPAISIHPSFVLAWVEGEYSRYTIRLTMPTEAEYAFRSLCQCVNVSASAMGTLAVPDDALLRFAGKLVPNHKYAFVTDADLTLQPEYADFSESDMQIVLYLVCNSDIDIDFGDCVFAGSAPNTDTGDHKLIFSRLPDERSWAVGGVDYVWE